MYVLASKNEQVTLGYGSQTLNGKPYNHTGIDLVKKYNQLDSIIAGQKGKVIGIQKGITGFVNGSYGNYVKLQHNNGYETIYAHLKTVDVNLGDIVQEGQVIGYMGATGMAYGAHLHFEVRKDGKAVDPTPFLQGQAMPAYEEPKPQPTKSIDDIAREVIAGQWGNGDDRKNRLTNAGYNYNEVQGVVNSLMTTNATPKKPIETIAREVIQGKWGNGQDRKNRLSAAGYDPATIQSLVNNMLK